MSVAAKTRERERERKHSEHDERERERGRESTARVTRESTSFSGETEGTCVSKNLDETIHLQSEKRHEWIGEVIGKRLQGISESTSSTLRLTMFISRIVLEKRVSRSPL